MRILAQTSRQLNRCIFQDAALVPPDLLGAAGVCIDRVALMLQCWYGELVEQQAVVSGLAC